MERKEVYNRNIERLRDKLDRLIREHEDIAMSGAEAEMQIDTVKEWLSDNSRLVNLIELIPKAKKAGGELSYITKGQYRKHWGREPKASILTVDGKRVRWEYALDELAQELGLERQYGDRADEALKDMIEMAVEYKHKLRTLRGKSADSDMEYKKSKKDIEKLTVYIGRREQVGDIQDERSEQSKAVDESLQAKNVVTFPNVEDWLDRPNRFDIRGVDTKRSGRSKVNRSRKHKRLLQSQSKPTRISG